MVNHLLYAYGQARLHDRLGHEGLAVFAVRKYPSLTAVELLPASVKDG